MEEKFSKEFLEELDRVDKRQKELGLNEYHRESTRAGLIRNYIDDLTGFDVSAEEMREQTARSLAFDAAERRRLSEDHKEKN
jgi:hypothetical protein